eukprot:CAMPEP_0202479692 /NCGR_PEP_ID=MMETSP1360-20130828/95114_1 /ASSEMBLY_ACC=CAM_ASM_000848 /TAXON_ID=515479 /ORGANISM="Licmophora paradoxa, Strain CCMP2313" /LENGTH=66 /DNA_ID=CAMNT_0049107027 /DNA_START=300 /DNA_END=500 /DNA_ORIENTATION=-
MSGQNVAMQSEAGGLVPLHLKMRIGAINVGGLAGVIESTGVIDEVVMGDNGFKLLLGTTAKVLADK